MTSEILSQLFKALSDPIRLQMVYLLLQKESMCVCEIMSILDLKQSTASRHLAYLKNSGLVNSRREGVWVHYQLKPKALDFINSEHLQKSLADEIDKPTSTAQCDSV